MVEDHGVQHAHVALQHFLHPASALFVHHADNRLVSQALAVRDQVVPDPQAEEPKH